MAADKAVGINTYVWNADTSASGQQNIAAAGSRTFQQHSNRASIGSHTAGWMLGDEVDMCCRPAELRGR